MARRSKRTASKDIKNEKEDEAIDEVRPKRTRKSIKAKERSSSIKNFI